MKKYIVRALSTGFFSGSLSAIALEDFLNKHSQQGYRMVRTIHETKRTLFGNREAHFVIFEREIVPPPLPPPTLNLEGGINSLAERQDRTNQLLEWLGSLQPTPPDVLNNQEQ